MDSKFTIFQECLLCSRFNPSRFLRETMLRTFDDPSRCHSSLSLGSGLQKGFRMYSDRLLALALVLSWRSIRVAVWLYFLFDVRVVVHLRLFVHQTPFAAAAAAVTARSSLFFSFRNSRLTSRNDIGSNSSYEGWASNLSF